MLDIKKLKGFQQQLTERAKTEYYEKLQPEIIQLIKSKFFREHFLDQKVKREFEQSSRVLNNWQNEGLIDRNAGDEGKWRKFNHIESVWIDIISTLREFGFPYDKIKLVKERLHVSQVKTFKPLEYAIMYSVIQEPIILVIYMDGKISMLPKSLYAKQLVETQYPPHLHFDLLLLSSGEFPNNNFEIVEAHKGKKLTDSELKVLYFIRSGDYNSIKVRMKGGEVYLLEAERKISLGSRVIEVIKKGGYQDIEIKTQEGKVVNFTSTEKIKL